MTNVLVRLTQPKSDGSLAPVRGSMLWEPTRRIVIEGAPDNVVLPLPFVAPLTEDITVIAVEPSGVDWAWKVTIRVPGHSFDTEYYAVPNEGSVDFGDLVAVDPFTLASTAVPEPAWYAYATAIRNGQIGLMSVVTGNEARPEGSTVLWIGGTVRPTNMASGDLWFAEA